MSTGTTPRPSALTRCMASAGRIVAFLLLLDILLFIIFDVLPSAELGQLGVLAVDPALLERARERMGTTGPWHERLFEHWIQLGRGSMGHSLIGNYSIGEVIRRRVGRSLPLWIGTLSLLPLAVLAAMPYATRRRDVLRGAARWFGQLCGVPQFLSAAVLFSAWIILAAAVPTVTHAPLRWGLAIVSCAALPLGVLFVAAANTFERCASERFCDTYLSLGMEWPMIRRRLLLNAVLALRPLIARLVLWTVTGSVLTETVFGITGFGQLLVEAMRMGDINIARSWMLLAGGTVLAVTEVERR